MARILLRLAVFNFLALGVAFVFGAVSWASEGLRDADSPVFPIHLYVGLFAIICNLGVHCIVFIYFLGTGRWVKEVAAAYSLPDEPLPKQTRELKRSTFPPALLAMLVPITVAAAGMANLQQRGPWAAPLHLALAAISLLLNWWALRIEHRNVCINAAIIDQVMTEVEQIRAARGLLPSAEAWKQQEET